jgi:hypothetical protein
MSESGRTQLGIPRSVAPFFQEYDLDRLDPERAAPTIIERILRYGNRAELRSLFHHYPRTTIVEWVARWGKYGLPAARLAFWRLFLGLDEERS